MTSVTGLFPAARQASWNCTTRIDKVSSPTGVTSVCYFQVPADATVALGPPVVIQTWPTRRVG